MKDTTKLTDPIKFIDAQGKRLKGDYQRLAQLRYLENKPKHFRPIYNEIHVQAAFVWERTPEGKAFWLAVHRGLNPAIPSESLKELKRR